MIFNLSTFIVYTLGAWATTQLALSTVALPWYFFLLIGLIFGITFSIKSLAPYKEMGLIFESSGLQFSYPSLVRFNPNNIVGSLEPSIKPAMLLRGPALGFKGSLLTLKNISELPETFSFKIIDLKKTDNTLLIQLDENYSLDLALEINNFFLRN
ncbi:MAG: hypothetical protein VXV96_10270 [Bdellovibrionota bacterium]|nr:hypothetical protein [Bdellovibrionota bacterium]